MKVALLGAAGGIGQALALLLKIQLPTKSVLALYDIAPVTPGIAVDLSHIPTAVSVTGYAGPDPTPALQGADIVLIAAGLPRKPGMQRKDLFTANAAIIDSLIQKIVLVAPEACLGIITNPLNSLVPLAATLLAKAGVYNWRKLFGITTLDQIRAAAFIAEFIDTEPQAILPPPVIGGHSAETLLPLFSQRNPLRLTPLQSTQITQRIQQAGTEVVNAKAGHGSATLAMAYAGVQFTLSLIQALQGAPSIEITAYVASEHPDCRFLAQPLCLGPEGIAQRLPITPFTPDEQQAFEQLLPALQADIQLGEQGYSLRTF
ncbi:MAG: malate dehydrogenase [Candidatus Symbiodolus clandestinus]